MKTCIAFVIALLLSGCASVSTTVSSVSDPTMRQKKYSKIFVMAVVQTLSFRKDLETLYVKELNKKGCAAISSIEYAPPLRKYTKEELGRIMAAQRCDALLAIVLTNIGESSFRTPRSSNTTTNAELKKGLGNILELQMNSTTSETGGYNVSTPYEAFDAHMFDLQSMSKIWYAEISSTGNSYTLFADIEESQANQVVNRLVNDGIIGKTR